MTSHAEEEAALQLSKSDGTPVTSQDWRGNQAADWVAKAAVASYRLEGVELERWEMANTMVQKCCVHLGLATLAANHFEEHWIVDGKERTKVRRDVWVQKPAKVGDDELDGEGQLPVAVAARLEEEEQLPWGVEEPPIPLKADKAVAAVGWANDRWGVVSVADASTTTKGRSKATDKRKAEREVQQMGYWMWAKRTRDLARGGPGGGSEEGTAGEVGGTTTEAASSSAGRQGGGMEDAQFTLEDGVHQWMELERARKRARRARSMHAHAN